MIINMTGGGAGLNLKVVGGTSRPGGSDTLYWDGNTEGRVNVEGLFYKVSDAVPTMADLASGAVAISSNDYVSTMDGDAAQSSFNGDGFAILCEASAFIVPTDNYVATELDGATFPKKGVYFMLIPEAQHTVSLTIPGYTGFDGGETVKDNTIWVNTDTEIEGWAFSSTQPVNPVEGIVWFQTDTKSPAAMNIDKKNTVMLYPTKCQQYVGGAWTSKIAKSYLNGTWADWWKDLYASGELGYELATGFTPLTSTTTVEETSDYIKYYNVTSSGNVGGISSEDPVDVTGYSTLKIKCRVTFNTSATDKYKCGLARTKSHTDFVASVSIPYSTNDETEVNIPVPIDGGEYYLVFTCGAVSNDTAGTQHVRISGIRLEA